MDLSQTDMQVIARRGRVDVVQAADEKLSSSLGVVSLAKQYVKSIAGCYYEPCAVCFHMRLASAGLCETGNGTWLSVNYRAVIYVNMTVFHSSPDTLHLKLHIEKNAKPYKIWLCAYRQKHRGSKLTKWIHHRWTSRSDQGKRVLL